MDNGQWVKGKESALWINAAPGLRPGTFRKFASVFCFVGFSFALLQELAKKWVIKLVAASPCTNQQTSVGQTREIYVWEFLRERSWTGLLVIFASDGSQQSDFFF